MRVATEEYIWKINFSKSSKVRGGSGGRGGGETNSRHASWHHSHHHHHHHRLHPHLHQEQRHLHQLHHLHNIHEKHQQHRRQHNHPKPAHHLAGHDWVEQKVELLPQQPHSHQHHHLRLQNNSQYPLHLQQRGTDQVADVQCCQPRSESRASEVDPQKVQVPEPPGRYPAASGEADTYTGSHFTGPDSCHQHLDVLEFQREGGHRERLLHPHCRHLVRGVIRARSATPPPGQKTSRLVLAEVSSLSSDLRENKLQEKRLLRNTLSLPNACLHADSSCSGGPNAASTSNKGDKNIVIGDRNNHNFFAIKNINNNNNNSDSTKQITNYFKSNSNNNSSSASTTTTTTTTPTTGFPNSVCPVMHLPVHTNLPDGCPVIVDRATEHHISQMYRLIQAAAMLGEGYGVDEYPTEDDFRDEIRGGHTFVVMVRGDDLELDDLEDEEDEEVDDDEEVEGIDRREEECSRGRLIAAFSLATSKFYRGNDVKVADPILIVRREERRKGIGEFLFRHAVMFSRRLGFAGVYTDTFSNNTAMIRIIERSPGFKMVGYLPLGGKMPDGTIVGANIYFKDLRANGDDSGSSR
ncbi:hypothetical protein RRG08_059691 [Elysia crispata]|uniref:N-acetyltransferase domain-containing protein n=1 Tax=Elysia crispata TaxID=231223 RepID=A0AAE1DEX5_9GAST|nr:hypothetical protein RRG08_059691 [Elysia crispata]